MERQAASLPRKYMSIMVVIAAGLFRFACVVLFAVDIAMVF